MPDPYQLWIPFKTNEMQPDSRLRGELHQNWLEIENWANNLQRGLGGDLPFIVVANDGSDADFTSIAAACDSIAVSTPTVIYVKVTGTNYTDTVTSIDISTKTITICTFPWVGASLVLSGVEQVIWLLSSSGAAFLTNSSTSLTLEGIQIVRQNLGTFFGTGGGRLILRYSDISSYGIAVALTIVASWSSINFTAGGTVSGMGLSLDHTEITTNNVAQTFSNMAHLHLTNCILGANQTITMQGSSATNDNKGAFITGCVFTRGSYVWNGADWEAITFTGNGDYAHSVFGPTLDGYPTAITLGGGTGCHISAAGNMLRGCDLTVNGGTVNIGGFYRSVVIDAVAGTFDLAVGEPSASFGAPANGLLLNADDMVGQVSGSRATDIIEVTGDNNVVAAAGVNETNVVNVSGNNNKFTTAVGATNVDTGAGNVFL